jgi:hypothetical protein
LSESVLCMRKFQGTCPGVQQQHDSMPALSDSGVLPAPFLVLYGHLASPIISPHILLPAILLLSRWKAPPMCENFTGLASSKERSTVIASPSTSPVHSPGKISHNLLQNLPPDRVIVRLDCLGC